MQVHTLNFVRFSLDPFIAPIHSVPIGGSCNVTCASGFSVAGGTALGYNPAKPFFQACLLARLVH